ncbi:MAG: hypothetical protein V1742_00285, partial [Pseudomonadota bacterium]
EYVAPVVCFLCSEECKDSGLLINTGGGCVSMSQIMTGPVTFLGKKLATVEDVASKWSEIKSMDNPRPFNDSAGPVIDFVTRLQNL